MSENDSIKRLAACKQLKKRITDEKINRTWFSDEEIFTACRAYANFSFKSEVAPARLLKGKQAALLEKCDGVIGCFKAVTPKAKVNCDYACEEVLTRGLLPDVREMSGIDGFIFQQDGAPAHRSRERHHDVHY